MTTPNPTLDKLTDLARRVGETIAASPAGELEKKCAPTLYVAAC